MSPVVQWGVPRLMEDLRQPAPDDIVAAAESSHALLAPLADRDWSVPAVVLAAVLRSMPDGARLPPRRHG